MAISSRVINIIHGILGLYLIIELGLTAYLVSVTDDNWWHDSPSSFAFMVFNSVWSILVLAYLVASTLFFDHAYQHLVSLCLLAITTLFWFAGSIAMADFIGVPDCHGSSFCQTAQAAVAFGFFIWAIFTGLVVLSALGFFGNRGATVDSSRSKPGQPYAGA